MQTVLRRPGMGRQTLAGGQLRPRSHRACVPRPRETSIKLVRFWKSYTPSGEEKRAVPAVGSTWLGPAQ